MTIIAGFTGSQTGMNEIQCNVFKQLLISEGISELHHGDCIGADEQADSIAHQLNLVIEIHPPSNDNKRAFCKNANMIHSSMPYLNRNKMIVNASDILFAAPLESVMVKRSGTWSTIRYALNHFNISFISIPNTRIFIICPTGEVIKF